MEKALPEKARLLALATLLLAGSGRIEAQVKRPRPNLLAGRILHDGKPIEGAKIHVVWLTHPELPGSLVNAIDPQPERKVIARSKAKGRFRIGLPHRGPFVVFATSGDKLRSALHFPVMSGDFREISLRPIPVVSGTVLGLDGRPVAGAFVSQGPSGDVGGTLERHRTPYPVTTVRTDAAGRFNLPVWAIGSAQLHKHRSLRAWTEDFVSTERFYLHTGQTEIDATIRLSRSTTCRGRIASPQNEPIANAEVVDPDTGKAVRSDETGHFTIKGVHGPAVVIHAEGYQPYHLQLRYDDQVAEVRLQTGNPIDVVLVRAKGTLAGHRVILATQPPGREGHIARVTRVGKDGRLKFRGIPLERPLSAFVECGGRFVQFWSIVPAGLAENLRVKEIRVEEERTIVGQVNDVDRQPIAGARVYLQPWPPEPRIAHSGGGTPLFRMTYTDRAGRFHFDSAMAGQHLLVVNAGSEGVHSTRVPSGNGQQPIVLTMPKKGVITGSVVDASGEPAPFAELQYICKYPGDALRLGLTSCYLMFRADEHGRFRIRSVPPSTSTTAFALFVKDGRAYRSLLSGRLSTPLEHKLTHYTLRR